MNDDVLQQIVSFFSQYQLQKFREDEILVRADEEPRGIYYLTEGTVKQYYLSEEGAEVIITIFKPHAFFPLISLFTSSHNRYFYQAITPVKVWRAPKEDTYTFLKAHPEVLIDLVDRLFHGMDGVIQRLISTTIGSAYHRLLVEIKLQASRFGEETEEGFTLVITEKELALRSGLSRETVSRELKVLRDKGLLDYRHGKIYIPTLRTIEEELDSML